MQPRVYVGTSGWLYDWNPGGSLEWYVANSGLNAVELNASFYRLPLPGQVGSWARKGSGLRWAVKVNRYITHVKRLKRDSHERFSRFLELFRPMDHLVDFYLLQLPPTFACREEYLGRVESFAEEFSLGGRLAVEFRHPCWLTDSTVALARRLEFTVVSIDSPSATWIASSTGAVYLRLHGRSAMYSHDYTREELLGLASQVMGLGPRSVHVFFNNNHWMLENARAMLGILSAMKGST